MTEERTRLIAQKLKRDTIEMTPHDFVMLQQITHKKIETRESLPYLDEKDDIKGHLFKYLMAVQGQYKNLDDFTFLLASEIQSEDEQLSHLISTKQMIDLQDQMNTLYDTSS